jgi:asparagine synthase (glutamine-hydrolysing)
MCQALRHRGPDDRGTYLSPGGGVALAARRLAVVDVENGQQPRSNEDGTVWTVFNGEIYNHPAIGEQLATRGHLLRGRSDTEVLPHLYEDYGDGLVHAIEGMFAFAIWDSERQRLLLARDRFGEKPLFYTRRGTGLVFASELTALVRGLGSTPDINPAALDAYFVLGYVPGRSGSILKGIQQLPPGHVLTWERASGKIEQRPYWRPPAPVSVRKEPPRELAAEAGRLLERSIRGRLRADVPLGVFLSGGIDSTLIAALVARHTAGGLKTFTVGYGDDDASHDERPAARRVASLLDSDHREVVLDAKEAAVLAPSLLAALDQPLADAAVVPLHCVAKLAGEEVVVAIAGEGADELFGGYPRYGWLGRAPRVPALSGRGAAAIQALIAPPRPNRSRRRRALDLLVPRPLAERHLDWVTGGRRWLRPDLYGPRLRREGCRDQVLAGLRGDIDGARSSVPGSLMHLDQLDWLPDDVLVKADRAGMLASLELRTPYLQRELAEFAASVDPAIHLGGGGKVLLRLLLAQQLPEAPQRRKVAFLPPVASWLRGPLGSVMADQIALGSLYREGWIRPGAAGRLLAEHRGGAADHSNVLWPLLAAGLWLDRLRRVTPA